jgi:hypothetical protein
MLQPPSDGSEYTRGYQQALNDFGITQLLSGIRNHSDADFEADRACMTQQEIESFAVFLILRVGANLKGSTIARYFNTLRKANSPTIADRPAIELNSNPRSKTSEKSNEGDRKSWAIVRILPNAQYYTIARFFNRQDADDRHRALCRFIPGGVFEVVFDRA